MHDVLVYTFGALGVATAQIRAWPQFLKILRFKHVDGVSSSTWLLMLCNSVSWTAIGISHHLLLIILHNAFMGLGTLAVVLALVVHKAAKLWPVTVAVAATLVADLVAASIWGRGGTAGVGFVTSFVMFLPQAIRVTRHPAEGVSFFAWLTAFIATVSWSIYGLLTNEWSLVLPGLVMGPTTLFILWRLVHAQPELVIDVSPDVPVLAP